MVAVRFSANELQGRFLRRRSLGVVHVDRRGYTVRGPDHLREAVQAAAPARLLYVIAPDRWAQRLAARFPATGYFHAEVTRERR